MQAFGERRFKQVNLKNNKLFRLQIRRREKEVRNKYYKEWEKELSTREEKKWEKKLEERIHKTTHGLMRSHIVILTILNYKKFDKVCFEEKSILMRNAM